MHHRLVRVSLVLIMLVVATGAVYNLFQIQQQIDAHRELDRAFSSNAAVLAVEVVNLRAAQQAYVAAGQDSGYWVEKVSAGMTEVSSALSTLTRLATTKATNEALQEAGGLMDRLGKVDELVRVHTASGQDLMASDLIFTDGLEITTLAIHQLDLARATEQEAYAGRRTQQRQQQVLAIGALVTTALVVTLLLMPARPIPQPVPTGAAEETEPEDAATLEAMPPPIRPKAPSDADPVVASPHHAELQRAAELCTDLGRLTSPDEIPDLLERAAELLHASGVIVWVRDASGTGLRPAVAHGYTDERLARLGSVACSSDNAAASAYRTRQLQVVPVSGDTRGAVVAPLLGPDECIGVISAEVKAGWESSVDVQATSSILAVQFSTVVFADTRGDGEAERAQQG
jgi:hypothetical protein